VTYFTLNKSVRRVLRLDDLSPVECEDEWFLAELQGPTSRQTKRPEARRGPSSTLRFKRGQLWPDDYKLKAAERVQVKNSVWELLEDPRPVVVGTHTVGWEVRVMDVDELYPRIALVEGLGDTEIGAVSLDLFSPDQDHRETGTYTNYEADAPIEHRDVLERNRQIRLGDQVFKITSAVVDLDVPHLRIGLRKAGIQP